MITKGEWKWEQTRGNNDYEHTVFTDHRLGIEIAVLSGEGCSPVEVKDNARLIAAAPLLLATCKSLLKAYRLARPQIFGTDAIEEEARAAIKTAT